MSDTTKDYSVAEHVVRAENAKLIGETRLPLLDDLTQVVVFWPVSDYKLADLCLEYLTLRVNSANETGTGDATAQQWMTEVLEASLGTVDGTWRIINTSLAKHANAPGVSMTLRRGFITKGANSEAYDQLWSLMPSDKLDAQIGKRQFSEYLAGVHPRQAESILDQLNSSALITDPVVNGQTLTGKFAPSNVVLTPNPDDGDLRIYRTMTEVAVITVVGTLSALTPYRVRNNEILEAFDFATGEEDEFVLRYTNLSTGSRAACIALTDAELVSIFTALDSTVSWTYITRHFIEQTDNTAHLEIQVKCVTWRSWTTNAVFTPDFTSDKDSPQGNFDTVTKRWEKIRRADVSVAMTAITTNSASVPLDSGYEIANATITDNHNGSVTVTQVTRKVLSNTAKENGDVLRQKIASPFGWEPGTIDFLTTVYDGYILSDLPASSNLPTGYTFLDRQDEPSGNWWKSTWLYGKVTWDAAWANAHVVGRDGPANTTLAHQGGKGTAETHLLPGVAQADVTTTITAAQTPAASGLPSNVTRVVTDIGVTENGETGEYVVRRAQKSAFSGTTATDALITEVVKQSGRREAGCTRVWWRRTLAAKNTLTGTDGVATKDFTVNGVTYLHNKFRVEDNGDTTFDVIQLGGYSSGDGGGGDTGDSWGETIVPFKVYLRGFNHECWVFTKYFATVAGAQNYIANLFVLGGDPISYGAFTLKTHKEESGTDTASISYDWDIVRGTTIDRMSNGLLYKAVRVELQDKDTKDET